MIFHYLNVKNIQTKLYFIKYDKMLKFVIDFNKERNNNDIIISLLTKKLFHIINFALYI